MFFSHQPVPRDVEFQGKILFLHSIGDSKETYAHIWPVLQNEGFEVISYDARGFGATSPGKLAGISNEQSTYQDLDKMIESVTEKYTGALFLAGVSMVSFLKCRLVYFFLFFLTVCL